MTSTKTSTENGADPILERLDTILELLTEFNENVQELSEKIGDLTLTANDGFGYESPES